MASYYSPYNNVLNEQPMNIPEWLKKDDAPYDLFAITEQVRAKKAKQVVDEIAAIKAIEDIRKMQQENQIFTRQTDYINKARDLYAQNPDIVKDTDGLYQSLSGIGLETGNPNVAVSLGDKRFEMSDKTIDNEREAKKLVQDMEQFRVTSGISRQNAETNRMSVLDNREIKRMQKEEFKYKMMERLAQDVVNAGSTDAKDKILQSALESGKFTDEEIANIGNMAESTTVYVKDKDGNISELRGYSGIMPDGAVRISDADYRYLIGQQGQDERQKNNIESREAENLAKREFTQNRDALQQSHKTELEVLKSQQSEIARIKADNRRKQGKSLDAAALGSVSYDSEKAIGEQSAILEKMANTNDANEYAKLSLEYRKLVMTQNAQEEVSLESLNDEINKVTSVLEQIDKKSKDTSLTFEERGKLQQMKFENQKKLQAMKDDAATTRSMMNTRYGSNRVRTASGGGITNADIKYSEKQSQKESLIKAQVWIDKATTGKGDYVKMRQKALSELSKTFEPKKAREYLSETDIAYINTLASKAREKEQQKKGEGRDWFINQLIKLGFVDNPISVAKKYFDEESSGLSAIVNQLGRP